MAEWGTIPDWIAAIGTAGALGATVSLLRGELRQRDAEQARLVACWYDVDEYYADEEKVHLVARTS